jgi:uncharacterized protein (TIGR02466 family)
MIEPWFPTPMYVSEITGDTFSNVQTELTAMYQADKSNMSKNPSWERDMHSLSDPTFNRNLLREFNCEHTMNAIGEHVGSYLGGLGVEKYEWNVITSWLTQTKQHEFARVHTHGNSDIAGVYYLDTNEEDGNLYFRTPNMLLAQSYIAKRIPNEGEIFPKNGKIALWPGYLDHGTRPNLTEHERVSLSFNIVIRRNWS